MDKKSNTTRRSFIKKIWLGLGIIAGFEVFSIIGSFFFRRKSKDNLSKGNYFAVGAVCDYAKNSVTAFRNHGFFLFRSSKGGFLALSIKCSHLGCNVVWEENNDRFVCPCHSSWFTKEGLVMHPPATRPLSFHPIKIEDGLVKVDTRTMIKGNSNEGPIYVFNMNV